MLYSFDVFDTIITRKTAKPTGIFKIMQKELETDEVYSDISRYVRENFYDLRIKIEKLTRVSYCYNGIQDVTLSQIYDGFVRTGYLTAKQACRLEELEVGTEVDHMLGIQENIDAIKKLLQDKNRVVLISDMYLERKAIHRILLSVDEVVAGLPLYVSSEYKKNKWNGDLFRIVKEKEKAEFSGWIHRGDNLRSDVQIPEALGIKTQRFCFEGLRNAEKYVLDHETRGIYTEYAAAASRYVRMQGRLEGAASVGVTMGANILAPYVLWLVSEAEARRIRRLYFIARDGYILKLIADKVIACMGYPIQTKYIYGSRKAWRLPAVSRKNDNLIDLISWSHTAKINNLNKLAEAFGISESDLSEFLPEGFDQQISFTPYTLYLTVKQLNENQSFKEFLICRHEKDRKLVKKYLQQNIDFSDDSYAFVELAGGGYTQRCLADILNELRGDNGTCQTFYFKMDRLNQWEECRQFVFLPEYDVKNLIIEMICRACHGQTLGYEDKDGQVQPKFDEEGKQLLNYRYDEYIDGIMKYTDYICEKNQEMLCLGMKEGLRNVSLYLSYLLTENQSEEFNFFADMPNNETGRTGNTERFAPRLTDEQIEKIFYSQRFCAREDFYQGSCFELSLLRSSDKQKQMIGHYKKKAREEMPVNIQEKTFERCFPFGILGKRIVLYAAGKYGNQLYDMIAGRPDRTVVQWVDKNHEEITNDKMKIAGLKELGQAAYDSVLIAVVDRLAAEEIRVDLMKQGVPAHKIVWFDKREIYRYLIGNQIFRWM